MAGGHRGKRKPRARAKALCACESLVRVRKPCGKQGLVTLVVLRSCYLLAPRYRRAVPHRPASGERVTGVSRLSHSSATPPPPCGDGSSAFWLGLALDEILRIVLRHAIAAVVCRVTVLWGRGADGRVLIIPAAHRSREVSEGARLGRTGAVRPDTAQAARN